MVDENKLVRALHTESARLSKGFLRILHKFPNLVEPFQAPHNFIAPPRRRRYRPPSPKVCQTATLCPGVKNMFKKCGCLQFERNFRVSWMDGTAWFAMIFGISADLLLYRRCRSSKRSSPTLISRVSRSSIAAGGRERLIVSLHSIPPSHCTLTVLKTMPGSAS